MFPNADLTGTFGAGDGTFAKGEYDFPQFKLKVDNDKTSSLEVPQGCMAQLFQHEGFGGDFAVFTPGTYTQEQMTKKGIANNDASSIKVQDLSAAGCHRKAKLFEHGWFDGTEHKFKKGEYNKAAFAKKVKHLRLFVQLATVPRSPNRIPTNTLQHPSTPNECQTNLQPFMHAPSPFNPSTTTTFTSDHELTDYFFKTNRIIFFSFLLSQNVPVPFFQYDTHRGTGTGRVVHNLRFHPGDFTNTWKP